MKDTDGSDFDAESRLVNLFSLIIFFGYLFQLDLNEVILEVVGTSVKNIIFYNAHIMKFFFTIPEIKLYHNTFLLEFHHKLSFLVTAKGKKTKYVQLAQDIVKQQKILRSSFMSFYSVVREASPVPKKKPAPKPKKKAESDDDEFPAKTNGTTNGKKADDADFMIVSDSDSDGEFFFFFSFLVSKH